MENLLDYIESKPERCIPILGITYDDFNTLADKAIQVHEQLEQEKESRKIRINAKGGGCPRKLTYREGICLSIYYLRHAESTFELLGLRFGVSKSTANNTFHYWIKILRRILPCSLLEQAERNGEELGEILEKLAEEQLIVDSFEQDIKRHSNNEVQRKHYSGKKKRHTYKSSVIGDSKGKEVVDIVAGKRGPESDITIFRKQQKKFSEEQFFVADKAYIGATNTETPHKKPQNQELTQEQKEENRELSSQRIFIEHLIRRIRIFAISRVRFPLRNRYYRETILTVCGLVRLRLGTLEYT